MKMPFSTTVEGTRKLVDLAADIIQIVNFFAGLIFILIAGWSGVQSVFGGGEFFQQIFGAIPAIEFRAWPQLTDLAEPFRSLLLALTLYAFFRLSFSVVTAVVLQRTAPMATLAWLIPWYIFIAFFFGLLILALFGVTSLFGFSQPWIYWLEFFVSLAYLRLGVLNTGLYWDNIARARLFAVFIAAYAFCLVAYFPAEWFQILSWPLSIVAAPWQLVVEALNQLLSTLGAQSGATSLVIDRLANDPARTLLWPFFLYNEFGIASWWEWLLWVVVGYLYMFGMVRAVHLGSLLAGRFLGVIR